MPIEFLVSNLRVQLPEWLNEEEAEQKRLEQLMMLEEDRLRGMWQMEQAQARGRHLSVAIVRAMRGCSGSAIPYWYFRLGWDSCRES